MVRKNGVYSLISARVTENSIRSTRVNIPKKITCSKLPKEKSKNPTFPMSLCIVVGKPLMAGKDDWFLENVATGNLEIDI